MNQYDIPFTDGTMHEFVISAEKQKRKKRYKTYANICLKIKRAKRENTNVKNKNSRVVFAEVAHSKRGAPRHK